MKRGGSIINTSSVTAFKGSPQMLDYSATKGAIITFTRSMAVQLAPKGIRVKASVPASRSTDCEAKTDPRRTRLHPSPTRVTTRGEHGRLVGRLVTSSRTSEYAG